MKNSHRALLFILVLLICAMSNIVQTRKNSFTMGQPISDPEGRYFVCQLWFNGGYGVVAFDTSKNVQAFARLPNVRIEPRALPVKVVRSDVIVEAKP